MALGRFFFSEDAGSWVCVAIVESLADLRICGFAKGVEMVTGTFFWSCESWGKYFVTSQVHARPMSPPLFVVVQWVWADSYSAISH